MSIPSRFDPVDPTHYVDQASQKPVGKEGHHHMSMPGVADMTQGKNPLVDSNSNTSVTSIKH